MTATLSPTNPQVSVRRAHLGGGGQRYCKRWHMILLVVATFGVGLPIFFVVYANQIVLHQVQHDPHSGHRVDPHRIHFKNTGCGGNLTIPEDVTDVRLTKLMNFTYAPFYHRAVKSARADEITLVLQTSSDRLDRAVSIARIWDGAISISLFMRDTEKDVAVLEKVLGRSKALQVGQQHTVDVSPQRSAFDCCSSL